MATTGVVYNNQQPTTGPMVIQYKSAVGRNTGCCSGRRDYYPAQGAFVLSVILIICGVLAIIFNAAGLAIGAAWTFVGEGFWCGILFLTTGILGVLAGKTKKTGLVIAALVLSIITCLFAPSGIAHASIGIAIDNNHDSWREYSNDWYGSNTHISSKVAMSAIVLTSILAAFFLSLTLSILSCVGLCRSNQTTGQVITRHQLGLQPMQHQIQATQQTGMVYGEGYPPNPQTGQVYGGGGYAYDQNAGAVPPYEFPGAVDEKPTEPYPTKAPAALA